MNPKTIAPQKTRYRRTATGLALPALAVVLLLGVPYVLEIDSVLLVGSVVILAVFSMGTNLLVGYGGLISFGQGAYYGAGAYFVALTWEHYKTPFWLAFLLAPVAGMLLAVVIGALSLRLRRLFFAMATLAFSALVFTIVEKAYDYTGGENGVFGAMVPNVLASPVAGYWFIVGISAVSLALLWKIVNSPFGLTLRAIRENRHRAEALGVNVYWHQLMAFIIAGGYGGLAGALTVVHDQGAWPQMLDFTQSSLPVTTIVVGGMNSFWGPALGAAIYQAGYTWSIRFTTHWQLILGGVLLLVILIEPEGVVGLASAERWRLRVRAANRWMRRLRPGD